MSENIFKKSKSNPFSEEFMHKIRLKTKKKMLEKFKIVIFFQNPSCFVPLSLFDKSHAEQYVSLHHKPKDSETLAFDILQEEAQVNLYYHTEPIKKILTEWKSLHL